jgi:hypothetical protein
MTKLLSRSAGLSLLVTLTVLGAGCNQAGSTGAQTKGPGKDTGAVAKSEDKKEGGDKHSGWWCDEHGVPEAECSQCSARAAAEAKKKGDWCEKHDRAKSQCFLCDPKLKERYAALYRAKTGKEPPATEEEEKAKEGDKGAKK